MTMAHLHDMKCPEAGVGEGGESYMKRLGMFARKFELNPQKEINLGVAQALLRPLKYTT